jgi:hypothetical protein
MAYSTTPTTKATITITSNGLTSEAINVSQTFELTAIDNVTGLKNSTGIRRQKGFNSGVVVYDADKHGAAANQGWIWVHNPNTSTNGSVYITITATDNAGNAVVVGKIFEGKSCLIPLEGHTGASDITLTTANAGDFVEYCVFAETVDNDSTTNELGKA